MCVYGFSISEELLGSPTENPAFCHFLVRGDDTKSAAKSSFVDMPCEEIDNYRCSASWSKSGYMILTVDNIDDGRRAYFGFKDDELESGQPSASHRSPSYVVIPPAAYAVVMPPNILPRGDHGIDVSGSSPILPGFAAAGVSSNDDFDDDDVPDVTANANLEAPTDANAPSDAVPNIALGMDNSTADAPAGTPEALAGASISSRDEMDNDGSGILSNLVQETTDGTPIVTVDISPDGSPLQLASYQESDDADDGDSQPSYDSSSNIHAPSVPAYPVTWGMRNITRDISYEPNTVYMSFMIDIYPDDSTSIPCHLTVDLDDNVDPMFASWFVEQCEDSDWYLSWGYNQMTDSAVATLINPERNEEAWFGWDFVNSQLPDVTLASAGPGIVQTCAC